MSFPFEHFDPVFEFGTVDKHGEPVRPRKRPGRKPNPPTLAQRKAQNRAAQRAFRARKRQEMREAELSTQRSNWMRDQAMLEAAEWKSKAEALRVECEYLKGVLLTYKLVCHANQIDVPRVDPENPPLALFLDATSGLIREAMEDKEAQKNEGEPSSTGVLVATATETTTPAAPIQEEDKLDVASVAPVLASHLETPFLQELVMADILTTSPSPPAPGDMLLPEPATRQKTIVALFPPTYLQRTIPHDTRIDLIPGAALRDHLILFQDFYDTNDLFNILVKEALFIGDDIGDPDCWTVPAHFIQKYWFILPNHRVTNRKDDAVDVAVRSCQHLLATLDQQNI
ncbi:hypothetical protein BX666DRAFT_941165 [Dichotomocladium elegans]|nr:hypothetical protein BX666DRAFT_941165 [Dichotomocladium elegans]